MNAQLKKGVLELCVLTKLCDGDRYGYELTESISQEISIATGTLYLVLKRLKDESYVDTYLTESSGGPARKYYHLTESGLNYQRQLMEEWLEFSAAVTRLLNLQTETDTDSTKHKSI